MAQTTALIELDAQYRAMREQAAQVSRPGRTAIAVSGAEAAEYLQGQLSNDVEVLVPGAGCYAALLDRKGHLQADPRVLRLAPDEFLLEAEDVVGPALLRHLTMYKIGREVEVADRSAELSLLSVIGPGAAAVTGAEGLGPEHSHREVVIGGGARAMATDVGVDLLVAPERRQALRDALLDAGAEQAGEEAAEIVRVEAGRPRFGHEMSDATMPAEAGIVERAVDFEKGCYIGQEPVARLHYRGRPNRVLRGLTLSAPARAGDPVTDGERELGVIGTACVSPAIGPIALAVIRREAEPGAAVQVADGTAAQVVELPFRT